MDGNRILTVVFALTAVAVLTLSVLTVCGGGWSQSSDSDAPLSELMVYGNADNNGRLDGDDLDYIASVACGETAWDREGHPYADANADGKVDSDDVGAVRGFLDGERSVMYYTDWNRGVSKVHFPVTGGIGVAYEAGLDAGILGGWYGQITAINKLPSEIGELDEGMYPGSHGLRSIKADTKVYEYELLMSSGISLATGEPFAFDGALLSQLERHNEAVDREGGDGYLDALLLPYSRDIGGICWNQTIRALGVMTGHQDQVDSYFEYAADINSRLDAAAGSGLEEKTYLAVFVGSTVFDESGTEFAVEYRVDGKENSGDVVNIERLPLKGAKAGPVLNFDTVSIQQIIEMDPDVIFLINSKNDCTEQQTKSIFSDYLGYLDKTRAWAEGGIIWCNFDTLGSAAGVSMLPYLASMIWPDCFDRDAGKAVMQDYFDRFTELDGDIGGTRFLPLGMADA